MTSRAVLTAAAAIGICLLGAGAGAGLYAAIGSDNTKTVVTQTIDQGQPVAASSGASVNSIYTRTYQGVVDIQVASDNGGFSPFGGRGGSSQAEGSGFVYDNRGDIITNEHVVNGATSITVRFWNGKTYKAKLIGSDSSTDLAVIRVSAPSSMLHPLTLGNSGNVKVGDAVIAIGSPFGLAETVTSGIVSALEIGRAHV